MKRTLPVLMCLIASRCVIAQDFPPIDISYDYAGLTHIRIVTNHLAFITHSLKTNLVAERQDLSSYDTHESEATLHENDRQQILDWIRTNDFLAIARAYPPTDPGSYGTAFKSTLDIKLSGVRHQASWDATSDCSEIRRAMQQLESICVKITEKTNGGVEQGGEGTMPR